jgi:hypothetical protein
MRLTIKDVLLKLTERDESFTVQEVLNVLKSCKLSPNTPWDHVLCGKWPPYTNRSNFIRLQYELNKYNIKIN